MARTWTVYIVEGRSGPLYTGITTDVARRLEEHNGAGAGAAARRGARWCRAHRPVRLVWQHEVDSRAEASRLEARIKKLRRAEKLALIAGERERPT